MAHTIGSVLGFDPGGDGRFGCAFLHNGQLQTQTCSSPIEAFGWAEKCCGSASPVAVGIDTLLHWSAGPGGWRPCDNWLKEAYPDAVKSVMSPNSLFGAMAIGGVALALLIRKRWPAAILNETHPKVLFSAKTGDRYDPKNVRCAINQFKRTFELVSDDGQDEHQVRDEHQLDAAISAYATMLGMEQAWPDIVGNDQSLLFPAGAVSYMWPPSSADSSR